MEKINHNFKKKFGQNFLTDNNIIVNTVSSVLLQEDDLVIEIGPGSGMLTKEILKKCRVLAYEIDTDLIDTLSNIPNNEKLTIIWDDFLKRDVVKDIEKFRYNKLYIIANLPYYITTPIITKVIESDLDVSKMVIMVQKEVGDRFSSKPGNKEYGSITVFLNYYFNIKKLFDVSRNCFYPKPNVDSVILMLEKKNNTYNVKDREKLFKLIRDSFSFKRKTIKNNLKGYDLNKVEEVLINNGYSLSSRAEELPLDVFIQIANEI